MIEAIVPITNLCWSKLCKKKNKTKQKNDEIGWYEIVIEVEGEVEVEVEIE